MKTCFQSRSFEAAECGQVSAHLHLFSKRAPASRFDDRTGNLHRWRAAFPVRGPASQDIKVKDPVL